MTETIVVGAFAHEANTFVTKPVTRSDFQDREEYLGPDVEENLRGTETVVGGVIEAAAAMDIELVQTVSAFATPGGVVECIPWNEIDLLAEKLEREGDDIAVVVTEAVASNAGGLCPRDGYLHELQRLANEHGVLFILDEVVTGFRLGLHGAQGHFDLDPDLSVFGKAIASGYPGSALTGKSEVMEFIESRPDGGISWRPSRATRSSWPR